MVLMKANKSYNSFTMKVSLLGPIRRVSNLGGNDHMLTDMMDTFTEKGLKGEM